MQEKTLNFILALVTGRTWAEENPKSMINKSIDLWDYEPGMKFILLHFMPQVLLKESIKINTKSRYINPNRNRQFLFRFYTIDEKKKAGIYHPSKVKN